MNNFEQILIRMGVDATAVVSGLNRVTSLVKGWAVSLAEEVRGKIGAFLAAGTVIEGFRRIKEEILEISRLSEELGENVNFIQSVQLKAQQRGTGIESLTRPLVAFNRQIGEAKRGIPEAVTKLSDMGIITSRNQLATLTYSQALRNLKVEFDRIGDSARQDALLNEAFGNSAYRVAFIFRQTQAEFDAMNQGSFFSKFRPEAVTDFQRLWAEIKTVGYGVGVTLSNSAEYVYASYQGLVMAIGDLLKNRWPNFTKNAQIIEAQAQKAEADKEALAQAQADIEMQEKKTELLNQQADLLQRQRELTADLADRNKSSISEMADAFRKMTGLPAPRLYGVSDRMRQAYRIDTLEKQATLAFERGNDALAGRLTSEALQLRSSLPWAKYADRDPMARTENELQRVNAQLEPVKAMAELVTGEHKNPN